MKRRFLWIAIWVSMMIASSDAFASNTTVTADLTVDNHYKLFLSTDDNVLGSLVGQSGVEGYPDTYPYDWTSAENFVFELTPGFSNYYLHVVGSDSTRVIAGFLGTFQLSDNRYKFENGLQKLNTDTQHWRVYTDNYGGTQAPVTSAGCGPDDENGVGPWGYFDTIDPNATWIWTNDGKDISPDGIGTPLTRYFTTRITVTPEPVSASLFLLGGGALAALRFRRKK